MVLNRLLFIFRDLILDSKVDRGMPRFAAAPNGPDTLPLHSRSAASIVSFSFAESNAESGTLILGSCGRGSLESQLSSTEKVSDSHTMTDRSIMFCNSRMLPGQGYE